MKAAESIRELYEARKIDAIYNNLVSRQTSGDPTEYEIRVDDFPVVGRTGNLESFMSYSEFINAESKNVGIILYKPGKTTRYAGYYFYFTPDALKNAQLSGIQKQNPIDETALSERIRKDMHYESLIQENEKLRQELEQEKACFKKLFEENEELKANGGILVESIGGQITRGVLKGIGNQFLGKDGLGDLNANQKPTEEQTTFKRKGEPEAETEDVEAEEACYLSEKEKLLFITLRSAEEKNGSTFLEKLFHLNYLIAENPSCLDFTIKQAGCYIKSRPGSNTNQQK